MKARASAARVTSRSPASPLLLPLLLPREIMVWLLPAPLSLSMGGAEDKWMTWPMMRKAKEERGRKGKERKGKERKGKERKGTQTLETLSHESSQTPARHLLPEP